MAGDGGQLAFDFDELAREDARAQVHEWQGAPLHFTTDYYPPGELVEAFEHWTFLYGHFDSYAQSHMWHRGIAHDGVTVLGEHSGEMFSADLRAGRGEEGPGDLLAQMICEPCEWHVIAAGENAAVEAWHDHALPGWRDLPVVPQQIRVRNESGLTRIAQTWIRERYPEQMQVPGAPIITERDPRGTRHVPGYSPWGGYDLSSTAFDADSAPSASRAVRRAPPVFTPASSPASRPRGRGLLD